MIQNLTENWLVDWKMTRNLVNFHANSWKSENLHLMGSSCQKHIKFCMKKYRRFISYDTRVWCKVWRTTGSWFQNNMTNLVNFNASSSKSENLHFDVLLLSIAYKIPAKICRRVISQDTEQWSKNSLFVWKMTWEIWHILSRAVKNLKIWTFMGYFYQK